MPVTIQVNGTVNSLVHKMSNGISTATIPDVCKTPSPGGPVPIPYPNIAQSITLSNGTTTVKGDRMMAAIKGSKFALSNGDNPGVAGGVKSSTFMKEATWILYSFDVKLNGKNACRFTDKMFHNSENTVNLAGVLQPTAAAYETVGPEIGDAICTSICEARDKANKGELPSAEFPTLQSYVASRHSTGFPRILPTTPGLLVEATWKIPDMAGGRFTAILSSTGRTLASGRLAPANFWAALGAGRSATTFRPDFTLLSDASKAVRDGNVKAFIEVKFKGDNPTPNQKLAKSRCPKDKWADINESDCVCS